MMVQFDVKRVSNGAESFMVSFDFAKTPITQVADYIIIAAAKNKASDIHFDPREDGLMVRFRIDGDCQDYTFIPKAYERNLTTRIKLLANMNITETRLPQDGAIKGEFGKQYLDMRVACLPTNQGEKIVVRILDYTRSLQGIETLGFHPKNLEKIKRMMGVPNGIILVTGATGSGKSTTTYSMLSGLNKPEVNIITVEDPVEMNIEGINQVQVNSEIGMTFAAALRSILREDPNVILIGEIRDSETAQIAVRASITGHLVMSTLHTNNALATVERLLDMDVERYLLSTALTGIISQRLAKQLCPNCRYQREATPYEKKVYSKFLHQDISMLWDANPKGCEHCRKGYRGRLAFHEVLELDEHVRNALNDDDMHKEDFAKMIYTGNTISMLQDALIKVLDGKTSFEEVYRTIEIENEDEEIYAEEIAETIEEQNKEEQTINIPTGNDLLKENNQEIKIPKFNDESKETTKNNQTTEPVQEQTTNLVIEHLDDAKVSQDEKISTPNSKQLTKNTIAQKPVALVPSPTIENIQAIPPLAPTIKLETEKAKEPIGYKIVMPDGEPSIPPIKQQVEVSLEEKPAVQPQESNSIQEEYKITSENLDDAIPTTDINQANGIQDVVTAPTPTAVEQITPPSTIEANNSTKNDLTPPSFDKISNPTAMASELQQPLASPIVVNEHPVEAPIPTVQSLSVLPSVSEETQEMATGAEVLNDPGIRIAEENISLPTPPESNTTQPLVSNT